MTEAVCHCGAVRLRVAFALERVTDCNCSICRRLGVLWAYYAPAQVTITGLNSTAAYVRRDKPDTGHLDGADTWEYLD